MFFSKIDPSYCTIIQVVLFIDHQPQPFFGLQCISWQCMFKPLLHVVCVYVFLPDGLTLPVNLRQKVYANGTLTVDQVQRQSDAGTYTCQAKNHHGHSSRRDVEIQVLSTYTIPCDQGLIYNQKTVIPFREVIESVIYILIQWWL